MDRARGSGVRFAAVAGIALLLTGCSTTTPAHLMPNPTSRVELVSYKDPYFPEKYRTAFTTCTFRRDARGDLHIVAQAEQPAAGAAGAVTRWLYIHMFWNPSPGKTHASATSNDACIQYVIRSDTGTLVYAGTGFVFPTTRWDGKLVVKLENVQLTLRASRGDAPELFGDSKLTGTLIATDNGPAAIGLIRDIELAVAETTKR